MLSKGEAELKCDMAETYGIYVTDFYTPPFPLSYLADLAVGLSDDSRIKRKFSETKLTISQTLQALSVDVLRIIAWQPTKDGRKGRNAPESIYKELAGMNEKKKDELQAFATAEEFEQWRQNKMR